MNAELPPSLLGALAAFVARHLGLHFPPERADDLVRGIRSAARELQFADAQSCARWLLSAPLTHAQVEALAGHLTVGETYFFRDRRLFGLIESEILPEMIRTRRGSEQRLRIWSAGCCTGEEPYSLAACLHQALPDIAQWRVSLHATDINPRFLHKLAQGVYSEWSFRETPAEFRERWFSRVDERHWQVSPELRAMVSSAPLNLVEDCYPSLHTNTHAVDLIFCRNVLIYFSPEHAVRVIRNLARCLAEGGWLVLGPTEIPTSIPPELVRVRFAGAILCRKDSSAAQRTEIRAQPPGEQAIAFIAPNPPATEMEPAAVPPTIPIWGPIPTEAASPENDAVYRRALALYREGRYAETEELLAEPAEQAAAEPRVLALLAHLRANQGRLAQARACCDRLVAVDKMNPASHYLRASLLEEEGDATAATAAFRRTLYLDPDFVLAHFALGNLARRQERPDEAQRHFGVALALARRLRPDEPLPEADGLTAGRLVEIIAALRETGVAA